MKIRKGFVSNSSSCSFIICGFKLPEQNIVDITKNFLKLTKEDIIAEMKSKSYYKDKLISHGYAGIPNMETSKLLLNVFDSMGDDDNISVVVSCEY